MQELLLILEDHWNRSPDLQGVPIYQASGLASQSLKVYQTYIEMMNDAIKQAFQVRCLCCSACFSAGWAVLFLPHYACHVDESLPDACAREG